MKITFLQGSVPLTKTHTFSPEQRKFITTNYPMVKYFNSFEIEVNTPTDFCREMIFYASKGLCLSKGNLTAILRNESRSGKIDRFALSEWIIFDLDSVTEVKSHRDFVKLLPKEFEDHSYIVQLSASHGISSNYKAHIIFKLAYEVTPQTIQLFIKHHNIINFKNNISLLPGGVALNYPLDPSVNRNTSTLYIAPPNFVGAPDPVTIERIFLVPGIETGVPLKFDNDQVLETNGLEAALIKELRKALGLNAKISKTKTQGGYEVITNPETMQLIGAPFEERGFTYLPINPHNKHTYYHPTSDPQYIHNFRDDSVVLTKQVLPDYWREVTTRAKTLDEHGTKLLLTEKGAVRVMIFRDYKSDQYYSGWCSEAEVTVYPTKSKDRLKDFARQNSIQLPDPIPDWTMEFNPRSTVLIDETHHFLNTFRPTPYMTDKKEYDNDIPSTIHKIIFSAVGDSVDCFDHFINWLAWIFQTRGKSRTAWVFQGVEGTGKGALFNLIIRPLFGPKYCCEKLLKNLSDPFNAWQEECLFVLFDETQHHSNDKMNRDIPNLIRHIITEPIINIRAMRMNSKEVSSYINAIFATNNTGSLPISDSDRRFNVCPEQGVQIKLPTNLEEIINNELPQFAYFLKSYQVDELSAHTALNNEAKTKLRLAANGDTENFFKELRRGNFEYFAELYWDTLGIESGVFRTYKDIIDHWCLRWEQRTGPTTTLRRDELMTVFNIILGNGQDMKMTPKRFSRLATKFGIPFTPKRIEELHKVSRPSFIQDPWGRAPIVEVRWTEGLSFIDAILSEVKKSTKPREIYSQ